MRTRPRSFRQRAQAMRQEAQRDMRDDGAIEDAALLAREQMQVFDRQEPEVRKAFAESLFGAPLDVIGTVMARGPNDAVKAELKSRDVFPCDLGTDGVVVETVHQLDRAEARRLRSLSPVAHPDPLP